MASRLCFACLWNGYCDSAPRLLLEMINLKLPRLKICLVPRGEEASFGEMYNEVRRETSVAGCRGMARDWQWEGKGPGAG